MARPRASTYDEQREAMLARAAELFARLGYTATTMNQVAQACGLTKPTLYHYFADKQALLLEISAAHVTRLEAVVEQVRATVPSPQRLPELIRRFMRVYAHAQAEHRVLTEDVRFLPAAERERVLGAERRVVAAFAEAIVAQRPDLAGLAKPLAMLLFGMMNWTFTWLRSDGELSYEALGEVVAALYAGGLAALAAPAAPAAPPAPAAPAAPRPRERAVRRG